MRSVGRCANEKFLKRWFASILDNSCICIHKMTLLGFDSCLKIIIHIWKLPLYSVFRSMFDSYQIYLHFHKTNYIITFWDFFLGYRIVLFPQSYAISREKARLLEPSHLLMTLNCLIKWHIGDYFPQRMKYLEF